MNDILSQFKAEYRHNRFIIDELMRDKGMDRFSVLEAIGPDEFEKFDTYYSKTVRSPKVTTVWSEENKLKLAHLYEIGTKQRVMAEIFKTKPSNVSMELTRMKRSGRYDIEIKPIELRRAWGRKHESAFA